MYENIFYAGLLLFIVGLIITAILFIKNNIAKIIGDLTGYNAKKAMKDLKKERTGKQLPEGSLESTDKNKQKEKVLFHRSKDKKTDVLSDGHDEKTDILPKVPEATDVLPVPTKRSEELLRQAQAVMTQQQKDTQKQLKEEPEDKSRMADDMAVSGVADIFEVEEDMTVLGGEFVSQMPTTVLPGDVSYENRKEKSGGLDSFLEMPAGMSARSVSGTHILPNGINALASDEELEELLKEEQLLSENIESENFLFDEDETGALADEDETKLLYDEAAEITSVLADEEVTSLLYDDSMEETSVLSGYDTTDILAGDAETSLLSGSDKTEMLAGQRNEA